MTSKCFSLLHRDDTSVLPSVPGVGCLPVFWQRPGLISFFRVDSFDEECRLVKKLKRSESPSFIASSFLPTDLFHLV